MGITVYTSKGWYKMHNAAILLSKHECTTPHGGGGNRKWLKSNFLRNINSE